MGLVADRLTDERRPVILHKPAVAEEAIVVVMTSGMA